MCATSLNNFTRMSLATVWLQAICIVQKNMFGIQYLPCRVLHDKPIIGLFLEICEIDVNGYVTWVILPIFCVQPTTTKSHQLLYINGSAVCSLIK